MPPIGKAAVIGAGVMGAGIAAQIANAGVPVLLLDVTREAAASALDRLLKTEPAAFMHPRNASLVTTGSIDEDLARISGCDWIIEAVVERLDVKRALYAKIAVHKHAGAVVSSNTSTIRLADLMGEAGEAFRRNFLITHFFNPPRYMRLLEIVAGADTDPAAVRRVSQFADIHLGKSLVACKDRPGFIANRLGCFWMQAAIVEAFAQGISVEEADAVMGKPFGIPRTGVFGLADLVGIDLLPHVNASLARALEKDDLFQRVNVPLPFVEAMIARGATGRKGGGGFYRINREQGKRKEAIDLATAEYHPVKTVRIDDGTPLIAQRDRLGRYAAAVMLQTLAYAALLAGDAADDIASIDEAMRLGYNWKWGPFQLIDRIGAARLRGMLREAGLPVAPILSQVGDGDFYQGSSVLGLDGHHHAIPRPAGVLLLDDIKASSRPILKSDAAALWDLGGGVACFELTTKMNTLDTRVFDILDRCIEVVAARYKAMVFYSDAPNFSAGLNLNTILQAAKAQDWQAVEAIVTSGQNTLKRLKYAPFPSVAAPAGLALGGGCELLLHCSAIQAHAECNAGLVEVGVGIIPAWGGCGEMLQRWNSDVATVFGIIAAATVSKSADHARDLRMLRAGDGITMNRARLLADARAKALALVPDYRAPAAVTFDLPGPSAVPAVAAKTGHDARVAQALGAVLSGGDAARRLTEDDLRALERREIMALARTPQTLARIEHMLETGKPLRN